MSPLADAFKAAVQYSATIDAFSFFEASEDSISSCCPQVRSALTSHCLQTAALIFHGPAFRANSQIDCEQTEPSRRFRTKTTQDRPNHFFPSTIRDQSQTEKSLRDIPRTTQWPSDVAWAWAAPSSSSCTGTRCCTPPQLPWRWQAPYAPPPLGTAPARFPRPTGCNRHLATGKLEV